MKKYIPLLFEEVLFFVMAIFICVSISSKYHAFSKGVALSIALGIAMAISYELCWHRLQVRKKASLIILSDGVLFFTLSTVFAVAVGCMRFFGFEPFTLTQMYWFGSRYALINLFTNIILIVYYVPRFSAFLTRNKADEKDDGTDMK